MERHDIPLMNFLGKLKIEPLFSMVEPLSKEPEGTFNPGFNLEAAVIRQKSFVESSRPFWRPSKRLLKSLFRQYMKFLKLVKLYGKSRMLVPTIGIDLFWHSHMLAPYSYREDCKLILGFTLNHDDEVGKQPLGKALSDTEKLWEKKYKKRYLNPQRKKRQEDYETLRATVKKNLTVKDSTAISIEDPDSFKPVCGSSVCGSVCGNMKKTESFGRYEESFLSRKSDFIDAGVLNGMKSSLVVLSLASSR
eukprot:TRINITY_DN2473_c0_g1_i1.p1 TRINITY_DN2473_c0_g1~~TRINITY_DN2473_c0_g1_i1.p1  ORF type:complete len:249 (+),score=33.96 TRINITY_DN2473_c0_g1_i1:551-1297(+)